MQKVKNLLLFVSSEIDKPYGHYASYFAAFIAKRLGKIENVTVFYGPQGVSMTKKVTLASLTLSDEIKKLVAEQLGIQASEMPDNLEQLARYEKEKLNVNIASCATFHVMDGFATAIEDTTNIEDFIAPLGLLAAAKLLMEADRVFYY